MTQLRRGPGWVKRTRSYKFYAPLQDFARVPLGDGPSEPAGGFIPELETPVGRILRESGLLQSNEPAAQTGQSGIERWSQIGTSAPAPPWSAGMIPPAGDSGSKAGRFNFPSQPAGGDGKAGTPVPPWPAERSQITENDPFALGTRIRVTDRMAVAWKELRGAAGVIIDPRLDAGCPDDLSDDKVLVQLDFDLARDWHSKADTDKRPPVYIMLKDVLATEEPVTLYTVLEADGRSYGGAAPIGNPALHSLRRPWPLPEGDRPGEWMPKIEPLDGQHRGYEVYDETQLAFHLGPCIFEVEVRGERLTRGLIKMGTEVQQVRLLRAVRTWNDRSARLFAADCAEHVLAPFERDLPDDRRLREAIEVARAVARGEADWRELSAAEDGAQAAAEDFYRSANVERLRAAHAAVGAVRFGAVGAAHMAAYEAMWKDAPLDTRTEFGGDLKGAEHQWQTKRLMYYLSGEVDQP